MPPTLTIRPGFPVRVMVNHLRAWLIETEAKACIPPRKSRNIIERMFNRLKYCRQLSLRTFRCPETFLAAAHIAATVIWCL